MAENQLVTELPSRYNHLEQLTVTELLLAINNEDRQVPDAVAAAIPQIEVLVAAIVEKMKVGGRLFYLGAGTSGRLGIVDASECPPTFGVDSGRVIGIIAGGHKAMFNAVEFAEDDTSAGWRDLCEYNVSDADVVIGISASGTAPYVLAALKACNSQQIVTGCICNNPGSPISKEAKFAVEVVTGPEFLTGSTRMKSGTAQKLVLNMISTAVMIKLGLVEGNKMVNMQLSNDKLINRGVRMLMETAGIDDYDAAKALLLQHGSVRKASNSLK